MSLSRCSMDGIFTKIYHTNRPRVGKYRRRSMYGICTYMWPKCMVNVFVNITVPWSIWDTWILWAMIYPLPWIPAIHWKMSTILGVPGYEPTQPGCAVRAVDHEMFSNAMQKKKRGRWISTWMSMKVIVTIVSKLVYNLLQGLITYLYRGEITQLHPVPTMDIIVGHDFMGPMGPRCRKNMPKRSIYMNI